MTSSTTTPAVPQTGGDAAGRTAASPWAVPAAGWKAIALRAWREAGADNISLVASGVAFCGVLALVPLLGAIVLSYGLIASPATVMENVRALTNVMPADAAKLIGEQLANVVQTSGGKKGFGLAIALGIALYGAMKGAGALVTALNIAYDEDETRGFVKLNLLSLAITLTAVLMAIVAVVAIAALGHLEALFPGAPGVLLAAGKILSYALMAAAGAAAAAALYRYGPDRDKAKWTWLTPGSAFTALAWLLVTLGFGFYVANFGSYDATYGSLGAAIVLLTWLYLSAYILLLGAELNCELERQTERDTTAGPERAMGKRGAHAADTVAAGTEPEQKTPGEAMRTTRAPAEAGPAPQSGMRDYATARVAARAARFGGMEKVTMLPAILTTGGLALLRRRGRAPLGVALLAIGGGLSWLGRRDPRD